MLEVRDLVVAYGGREALHGVSLTVERGRLVCLIGANGAGKTSLLNAISGIVPKSRGQVFFEGRAITRQPAHQIVRLGLAQVPEGREILAKMTVEENLRLGGYFRRDRADFEADLRRMVDWFPILGERPRQLAGTLSGGEQQMLAIARGLLGRPRLLLLDEPSMGLAPRLVADVFATVRRIVDGGTTVLLAEQNAAQALAIADYAYVVELGRIALEGASDDLRASRAIEAVYLGAAVQVATEDVIEE